MGFPLGIGINTGNVFMGAVGTGNVTDITPLGDNVNVTAHLSSELKTGEIYLSDTTYNSPACKTYSSQHLLKKLEFNSNLLSRPNATKQIINETINLIL